MFASLSASSDRIDESAGITLVPGIPRGLHDRGQIERDQIADAQQQPGVLALNPLGPLLEVDHAGPR